MRTLYSLMYIMYRSSYDAISLFTARSATMATTPSDLTDCEREGSVNPVPINSPQQCYCLCGRSRDCEIISTRAWKYRHEIVHNVNPSELVLHMYNPGLIDLGSEDNEFLLSHSVPRCRRVERVLDVLDKKGAHAYLQFLQCLENETSHMGHAYIASLLQGKQYANQSEIDESTSIKEQMISCMPMMGRNIDKRTLIPLLRSKELITDDECERLLSMTERDRLLFLFQLLETKGPTAYYIFRKCLSEEDSHPSHLEMAKLISSVEVERSTCELERKRKAEQDEVSVPVPKRLPNGLEAQDCLATSAYFETMSKIRKCHLTGCWDEAEQLTEAVEGGIEVKIAVLLESCTGFITRCESDTVLSRVERAKDMCLQITNCNYGILKGRCEWVLAKLYRYAKQWRS